MNGMPPGVTPDRSKTFDRGAGSGEMDAEGSTPVRVGIQTSPPGYRTRTHCHPYMEIVTVLEGEGEGWIEDSWVGQPVQVGAVTLLPTQPCIRCTMVTRSQPGLAADREVFRTLARHHGGLLGVWSEVLTPGTLSVGDRALAGPTS